MSARTQAIFERQIQGDHALFALAQHRFAAAGLAPEFSPVAWAAAQVLAIQPLVGSPQGSTACRAICKSSIADAIRACLAFAATFPEHITALVLHDRAEVTSRFDEYVAAARDLDRSLQGQGPGREFIFSTPPDWNPRCSSVSFRRSRIVRV